MRWLDGDPEAEAERAKYREAEAERDRHRVAQLDVADAQPPEFSDEALALKFSAKHAGEARYVAEWGRWLWWNKTLWEFDRTLRAFDVARNICRVASAEIGQEKAKFAATVASAKTVAAVVNLARADRRHSAITEQWDTDAWSLTTPKEQ